MPKICKQHYDIGRTIYSVSNRCYKWPCDLNSYYTIMINMQDSCFNSYMIDNDVYCKFTNKTCRETTDYKLINSLYRKSFIGFPIFNDERSIMATLEYPEK